MKILGCGSCDMSSKIIKLTILWTVSNYFGRYNEGPGENNPFIIISGETIKTVEMFDFLIRIEGISHCSEDSLQIQMQSAQILIG